MATLIDAGHHIALSDPRDELHDRALAWSRSITGQLIVTDHVLAEAVNAHSATRSRVYVHDVIASLLSSEFVELVRTDLALFDKAMTFHRGRQDKTWSLTDCISFIIMESEGIRQALAYDRHFEQAGFEALLRRDPA